MILDKDKIKQSLKDEQIFEILNDFGGDPIYTSFGLISSTICHNPAGVGSRKLYYYSESKLFHCYTGCDIPSFDIFELISRIFDIQQGVKYNLVDSMKYIAYRFNIFEGIDAPEDIGEDWKIFKSYDELLDHAIDAPTKDIILKEYDKKILDNFNYRIRLIPWLREGINEEAIHANMIGYYPGGDQITIPHFDKDNRLIGIRGRTMCKEEAELYGKYRPLIINGIQYSHPLGMNLYNLNVSKNNISKIKKAIVFESEKSCLMFKSYFGINNDISVACCGSNLSARQVELLLEAGAQEIIIAFDRQFQEKGDAEYKHLTANLLKINERYKNDVIISVIFDNNMITSYKASPIDEGKEKFNILFKERKVL